MNWLLTQKQIRLLCVLIILSVLPTSRNYAQSNSLSNKKYHTIHLIGDTIIREQVSIIPGSVQWNSTHSNEASLHHNNSEVHISAPDTVRGVLSYRVFDFNLIESKPVLDSSSVNMDERIMLLAQEEQSNNLRNLFIQSGDLNYRGSFTRGISFGNTQDLVLNSNLNLQLSGDLGNGLMITAAISDDNIPLQAEGNTQILQEFNKVFIEIKKDNVAVVAGDYELASPNSHFMKYFKKLKGISVSSQHMTNNNWRVSNEASFAVSRGKFRRLFLETTESNQGPYKLDGENGELFLQILSGTEKIYADGRLLKRGENNDYVIDYNRAEIRFTPNLIITANLRIIVEFEYSVQNYLRSLYATKTEISNEDWTFNFNIYSEQDGKTSSGNIELDSTDLRILEMGGDSDNFRSGIFPITDNNLGDIIAYRFIDNRLEFAMNDTSDVFGARFSNLGENMGDYEIDENAAANGRVYKYVGENMGSYLPVVELIAPEQRQMFTASGQYNISDSTHVFVEAALSNRDLNRFSSIDDDNNRAYALASRFSDIRKIGARNKWELSSHLNYELQKKNFEILNPYRTAEFIRDWNLNTLEENNDQHLVEAEFKLSERKNWLYYKLSSFRDEINYKGIRQNAEFKLEDKGWMIRANNDWLHSEYALHQTDFMRPRVNLQKSILDDKLILGGYFEKEENTTVVGQDSLSPMSFDYELYRFFIKSEKNKKAQFHLSYSNRVDDRRLELNALEKISESSAVEFGGKWDQNLNSSLNWQIVLRQYSVEDNFLDQDSPTKSLIGNIDHRLNLFNKGVLLNSFYESNSGQEPKIEFQFVRVQTGEGSYVWNDYNQDSIQQINEFEISPFSDLASYEKISVFNDEFISTRRYVLNQSLRIDPKRFLKSKESFLSKLYIQSKYRIDQKDQSSEDENLFSFINFDLNRANLVSFNSSFDHNLFINRADPVWDVHLAYRKLNNKLLQITGFEQLNSLEYFAKFRYNLKRKTDLIIEGRIGERQRSSENFDAQNFTIESWAISPQITYRPTSKFRSIVKLELESKEDVSSADDAMSDIIKTTLELNWRQSSTSSLELEFSYVSIDFTGAENSPIEFEMLQGLKNGNNLLWRLNYIHRISNNIEMLVNYMGRKSENNSAINTASVQMRAIF